MSCYWLQFPLPSLTVRILVLIYYIIIGLLSISLNGLVIFLWLRYVLSLLSSSSNISPDSPL